MFEFLARGGIMMLPLILSSIVALGVAIDRIWVLRYENVIGREVSRALFRFDLNKNVQELLQICRTHTSSLARLAEIGVLNREKTRQESIEILNAEVNRQIHGLERGFVILEVIAGITPLLGLLGTVIGMVHVFDVIALEGVGQTTLLSKGISEALVTTITGLSIAIPTLATFNFLNKRIDTWTLEMERHLAFLVQKLYPSEVLEVQTKEKI